jgi:hypothetical protein
MRLISLETFVFDDGRLLADVIFIIRSTIQVFPGSESHHQEDITDASSKQLEVNADSVSKILQSLHQFCSLLNQGIAMDQRTETKQVTFILH